MLSYDLGGEFASWEARDWPGCTGAQTKKPIAWPVLARTAYERGGQCTFMQSNAHAPAGVPTVAKFESPAVLAAPTMMVVGVVSASIRWAAIGRPTRARPSQQVANVLWHCGAQQRPPFSDEWCQSVKNPSYLSQNKPHIPTRFRHCGIWSVHHLSGTSAWPTGSGGGAKQAGQNR